MTLVVETGAGLNNAESYASVAEADTYHSARGNVDWESVDDKDAALRKATDYMLQTYTMRWVGARKSEGQALDWPRVDAVRKNVGTGVSQYGIVFDSDSVPAEVKRACIELALRAAAAPLTADLEREVMSESVVGAVSTTYRAGGARQTQYSAVDKILAPALLVGNGFNLTRA